MDEHELRREETLARTAKLVAETELAKRKLAKSQGKRGDLFAKIAKSAALLTAIGGIVGLLVQSSQWIASAKQEAEGKVDERLYNALGKATTGAPGERQSAIISLWLFINDPTHGRAQQTLAILPAIIGGDNDSVTRDLALALLRHADLRALPPEDVKNVGDTLISLNRSLMRANNLRGSHTRNQNGDPPVGTPEARASSLGEAIAILIKQNVQIPDLSGLYLRKVDLSGEKMDRDDFSDSVLDWAKFSDCHLEGAIFDGAEIEGTNFEHADLQNAQLTCHDRDRRGDARTTYVQELFNLLNQSGKNAPPQIGIYGPDFTGADLRNADFSGQPLFCFIANYLKGKQYSILSFRTKFDGARLDGAKMRNVRMFGASQGFPFGYGYTGQGSGKAPYTYEGAINMGPVQRGLSESLKDKFQASLEDVSLMFAGSNWQEAELPPPIVQWLMLSSPPPIALPSRKDIYALPEDETLAAVIERCRVALQKSTKNEDPAAWAETQCRLGGALMLASENGKNVDMIKQALAAYTEALAVFDQQNYPAHWASLQLELGKIWDYSAMSANDGRLHAAGFYKAALPFLTKGNYLEAAAWVHLCIGEAYAAASPTVPSDDQFARTVAEYTDSSGFYIYDKFPFTWARLKEDVADQWFAVAEKKGASACRNAIAGYEDALKVITLENQREAWMAAKHQLAAALYDLPPGPDRGKDLRESIQANKDFLSAITKESDPDRWAETQRDDADAWSQMPDGDQAANLQNAIAGYTEALSVNRKDTSSYVRRGEAYGRKGDYDSAIADATAALQLDPKNADAYFNRGYASDMKNDHDKAIADFTEALQFRPDDFDTYEDRGFAYEEKGDHDKAIADYTAAMKLNGDNADVYFHRGFAYDARGDHDKAIADYTESIRLNPREADAYENRGYAYEEKSEYEKAISDYTEGLKLDPNNGDTFFNRGYAYEEKRDYVNAIADYTSALRLKPNNPDTYFRRGYVYDQNNDPDRAIADFTDVVRLDPNYGDAYYNRGDAYEGKGDHDKAIVDYTDAIRLNPKDPDSYDRRGYAYGEKGDYDKAIADYTEALQLNPKLAVAYVYRGNARQSKGEYDDAITDFTEALQFDHDNDDAYYGRAYAYESKGDYDKAVVDYTNSIRLSPTASDSFNGRGYAFERMDDHDKAIDDYTKALELKPDFGQARLNRADAYAAKGDYDKAIADFTAGLLLNPNDSQALYGRGIAYEATGDYPRAIADYAKSVGLNAKNADYARFHLVLLLRRQHGDEALAGLSAAEAGWPDGWTKTVGRYLAGSITEGNFIGQAGKGDAETVREHRCEAYYYAGMMHLLKNDYKQARGYFQKCVGTGVTDFDEYNLARAEIGRLPAND
jgi:tetratricopeptide (TPR) repeat protein/uncharacterized protein YjbI with pentapeptide repeats